MGNKVIGTTKSNIPVQADVDMQNLVDAIVADDEGNVEVGRNLHVDGKLLTEGGIASNGTTDLGDLEGHVLMATNPSFTTTGSEIYVFGNSVALCKGNGAVTTTIVSGTEMFLITDQTLATRLQSDIRPFDHILCKVQSGSFFWLVPTINGSAISFAPNINLNATEHFYFIACVRAQEY